MIRAGPHEYLLYPDIISTLILKAQTHDILIVPVLHREIDLSLGLSIEILRTEETDLINRSLLGYSIVLDIGVFLYKFYSCLQRVFIRLDFRQRKTFVKCCLDFKYPV